jgi:predicted CXXCH cytochrome family protein
LCEVGRRHGRLGLALGALLTPLLLAVAVALIRGQATEADTLRVLFPQDECVLESGKFDLLCLMADAASEQESPPELRVDGSAGKWEPYKPPVLVCRLELDPGLHELVVGSQKLRLYVRGESGADGEPEGWPVYPSHQESTEGWEDCSTCHELTKDHELTVVGPANEPEACSQCHSAIDFEGTHFHPRAPLNACHTCHDLHGSSNPSLLTGEAKKLCADCHD